MTARVLVVNAGSSSLKLRLLGVGDVVERSADLTAGPGGIDPVDLAAALQGWEMPDVVGHRVVHGGTRFDAPVRIDAGVRRELEELTALAPLHQPKSLAALDAVTAVLPDTPAVACFDTAFHTTIPEAAATYAVPLEWREQYAIRRYGFHGLSHSYAARRAGEMTGRPSADLGIVTCHIGAGASICAVRAGRSVDTTMGFTPLEGVVMATRSGSIDPGLVLWLEEHEGLSPHQVTEALEQRSGLAALAGTSDLQEVEQRAARGDDRAILALDVYVHSLVGGIASMTASAGGVDVLVFTGGVGENSALVRQRTTDGLAHLGVGVDPRLNSGAVPDGEVTATGATVRTLVVAAREDVQIAAGARSIFPGTFDPRHA
ncbi:acetate/propionate family kinase [Aeromicrobium sp. A1-2]|uniref:acetate/propionate family kinase n=1 Tax=Aeromicrobium sp. A1-2 TaxID=2107713 RepID=UPI000E4ABEE9|nr:acetate/propionate family kinase [Aeromicrobium sp. A1-2]AXT86593.1 acetate/propionate family kinase [Aeromicrobium sp. A1-2]